MHKNKGYKISFVFFVSVCFLYPFVYCNPLFFCIPWFFCTPLFFLYLFVFLYPCVRIPLIVFLYPLVLCTHLFFVLFFVSRCFFCILFFVILLLFVCLCQEANSHFGCFFKVLEVLQMCHFLQFQTAAKNKGMQKIDPKTKRYKKGYKKGRDTKNKALFFVSL